MTLLEIALVACPSSSVGFVLGAVWPAAAWTVPVGGGGACGGWSGRRS
jgi:hypothetical protein